MKRTDFIQILASSTPEELNQYLHEKGKPAKPICPVVFRGKGVKRQEETNNGKM